MTGSIEDTITTEQEDDDMLQKILIDIAENNDIPLDLIDNNNNDEDDQSSSMDIQQQQQPPPSLPVIDCIQPEDWIQLQQSSNIINIQPITYTICADKGHHHWSLFELIVVGVIVDLVSQLFLYQLKERQYC
jgi:hypothetical protein